MGNKVTDRSSDLFKNAFDTKSLKQKNSKGSLPPDVQFILSSTDIGVRRNLGRPGSAYSPSVLISQFMKMNNHLSHTSYHQTQVSSKSLELDNFQDAQKSEANKITSLLQIKAKKTIHLGGGHDHAFPLLLAVEKASAFDNIAVLNIDAHCDTRVAQSTHSGTPFRDFSNITSKPYYLYQYGIHKFANSKSTLAELKNGTMHINFCRPWKKFSKKALLKDFINHCPFEITDKTFIFISLDTDAIDSSHMSAVSAVNHNGLEFNDACKLINIAKKIGKNHALGIYEYNPLFDDLSCSNARKLSYLIHEYIKD